MKRQVTIESGKMVCIAKGTIERSGLDPNVAVDWALTGKIKNAGTWVRRVL